jgi:two-component sensor histidine kinase
VQRLVRIDLPRRLARKVPRRLTELAVGMAVTAALVALRAALMPVLDVGAPFALGFLAVVLATLVGGWRSGLVAVVLGQTLLWYLIVPVRDSFALTRPSDGWGLAVTTLSQLVILAALNLYQREVRAGELERRRRINFLGQALREMDHRTKNNFQIVTSMLQLQASKADGKVRAALREAAERLQAISAVYATLTPSSQGLGAVRLHDQLEQMCDQIRRGILPEGIALRTELEPLLVSNETAVGVGIIVNELVTNACKHAFTGRQGIVTVRARKDGAGTALVEVADDGHGFEGRGAMSGLGTRLIAAFVQRLKATADVRSSPEGTVHSIRVPLG